jgi:DNA-binding YbaB/EbfC family protein
MPQPPNLNKMLEQAQQMLAQQQEAQEKLKDERVEATAGGGMVRVVMTGDLRIEALQIDPDAVDPEDVEMLQDMVTAAVNEAIRSAEDVQQKALGAGGGGGFDPMSALDALGMGGLGGGMGGPGGPGAPGGLPGGGGGAPNRAARRRKR